MKRKQIIKLISYFFIFCLGASLLINPSLGLDNENYLFFIIMILYALISYILYMTTRKRGDYEYLFTSLASIVAGSAGIIFKDSNPILVLSLSLVSWIAMVAVIKLIKIDYYHDRNNLLWVVRSISFVLFLIIGTLTCVNLYYNIDVQSLMLGFFFISVAVLESLDPLIDYLMFRKVKAMNTDFKPMIVKEHGVVTVDEKVLSIKKVKKVEPKKVDLSTKTIAELKELAKKKGIKGYSKMKKQELINVLETKKK